jgi:hypothetical protein
MQVWSDLGHGQVCLLSEGKMLMRESRVPCKGISRQNGVVCGYTRGHGFHNRLVSFEVSALALFSLARPAILALRGKYDLGIRGKALVLTRNKHDDQSNPSQDAFSSKTALSSPLSLVPLQCTE